MATYELELTKQIIRHYTVIVPDFVSPEDAKEWCEEKADYIWDVEDNEGPVSWEDVKDLEEGKEVTVSLECTYDTEEYEAGGFFPWKTK